MTSEETAAAVCGQWERAWNERVPAARAALLESVCDAGVTLVDPGNDVRGRAAVGDAIGAVQARTPGMVFRLTGPPDAHHHVIRVPWETAAAAGRLRGGVDVLVLGADGRITAALGFADPA